MVLDDLAVRSFSRSAFGGGNNIRLTGRALGFEVSRIREGLGLSHNMFTKISRVGRSDVARVESCGFKLDSDRDAVIFGRILRGLGFGSAETSDLVDMYIDRDYNGESLGRVIRRARITAGYGRGELSHLIGMHRSDLERLEIGSEEVRIQRGSAVALQTCIELGEVHLKELLRPHAIESNPSVH